MEIVATIGSDEPGRLLWRWGKNGRSGRSFLVPVATAKWEHGSQSLLRHTFTLRWPWFIFLATEQDQAPFFTLSFLSQLILGYPAGRALLIVLCLLFPTITFYLFYSSLDCAPYSSGLWTTLITRILLHFEAIATRATFNHPIRNFYKSKEPSLHPSIPSSVAQNI